MTEVKCYFCDEHEKFEGRMLAKYKWNGESPWVYVPREPANFGHLVVVSGKHYSDITEVDDIKHLGEIMALISKLASKMKSSLRFAGKKCEKIYVVTQCETKKLHLHFHLIPRFEGDKTGNMFLFERELEEVRWQVKEDEKCPTEEDKLREIYSRIGVAEGILDFHRNLILSHEWMRRDVDRKIFIDEIKDTIDNILKKDP